MYDNFIPPGPVCCRVVVLCVVFRVGVEKDNGCDVLILYITYLSLSRLHSVVAWCIENVEPSQLPVYIY